MSSDDLMNGTLSQDERDTLGEMTGIAMGAAGSTLGILLGQEVEIATADTKEYEGLPAMDIPFGDEAKTIVTVQYVKGIQGTSLYIFKNADVRKLAEMMVGSGGENTGDELSELETGAIGEIMNQMMNSAATSLASVIHEAVEIGNPAAIPYSSDALAESLPSLLMEPFIAGRMHMKIGGEPVIEFMELKSAAEIKNQVARILSIEPDATGRPGAIDGLTGEAEDEEMTMSLDDLLAGSTRQPAMAATAPGGSSQPRQPAGQSAMNVDPITVRPVEFASFDHQPGVYGEENKNLELVMDVTLNLTVELGKTELSIKDVLELTRGSVIELDRVAGEPVDLMANGKLIAKGEVVVIEDNFGLRITSIVSPADRLRGL